MGNSSSFKTPYYSLSAEELLAALPSSPEGLSSSEAQQRLKTFGRNSLRTKDRATPLLLLLNQFKSPLVLILVFAAAISALTGEWVDAIIVLIIIAVSAALSFVQEYNANNAVERLRTRMTLKANVLRDGKQQSIMAEEVVPGDVVLLSAGSLIPADGVVLKVDDFFVNQAVLTGETFPVEKRLGPVDELASLPERTNCVFMGTNVRSGNARVLIIETGSRTTYGQIAERLTLRPPETEFERGIGQLGNLLTYVMVMLVLVVFAINVVLLKPAIDSLLFAVALAVGITPELLPAIISITLSKGAQSMAKRGVIVKRLASIENFGSMDVLCTDKTGTLTLGVVSLDGALDPKGHPSDEVFRYAYLNAYFQTGLINPLDEAIVAKAKVDVSDFIKTEEIPYDFVRKRLSVVVRDSRLDADKAYLITKGALDNVLAICGRVQEGGAPSALDEVNGARIQELYARWSDQGFRVLGLATKIVQQKEIYTDADESDMAFFGFLLFLDPPKLDAQKTIADLGNLGVKLKIITGDNHRVAMHVAQMVGLEITGIVTGVEMNRMHDEALWQMADRANIFAEVDPNQKERIISALHKTGHVVGYLGDGINDAPALHAADVGISVDSAVDVAKQSADFVLQEHSLDVLRQGIEEGRSTFANTLKYVFTTTSANFGNMISMAGLSPFLPFLPLLPKQILLNNFLSDFPSMAIATDNVDHELVEKPRRWNVRFIRDFMIVFGLISSIFDYLTFGTLLLIVHAGEDLFRTGWFVESVFTELFILMVVRTRRSLFKSRPGRYLWISTLLVGISTFLLPYLPSAQLFNFVPMPPLIMLLLVTITLLYILANEVAKRYFYRKVYL